MPPPPTPHRIAILGAGITGLTAAWHLRRAGLTPVVFEKFARVGGAIGTVQSGGWLHELGPNSLLESSPAVAAFIEDIGLGERRRYASPAAKQRYVVRNQKLVAMPTSPAAFATTQLFSWRAKARLLGEPWRRRAPNNREESVADFVTRRLGPEFLDYAVSPFVAGVYAGDPAKLSVRHAFPKLLALEQAHGSLMRGALARRNASGGPKGRIVSFPDGLAELPDALARALAPDLLLLRTEVKALRRTGDVWELHYAQANDVSCERFAAVVCALPADALASLALEGVPGAGALHVLRDIVHPPVTSVFTGYRRGDIRHPLDGFGVLMPGVERAQILGTLFSSTLFPGRAPAGHLALTSFVGGMRQPAIARLDDAEILRVVHGELSRLLGIAAEPVFTRVQRWPRAIPQYTLAYQRFKDAIAGIEAAAPRLFIGGNCRDGISLANCIESGGRLAKAAIAALS